MSGWNPELTVGDARSIRDTLLTCRIAAGERLIGAKVSLGGTLAEPRFGSLEPRLGWLTDAMLLPRAVVDLGELIRPRVEPKLAFLLARPLRGPVITAGDLLAATDRVFPCIEIVDSRYEGTASPRPTRSPTTARPPSC